LVCIAIPVLVTLLINSSEAIAEVGGQPRPINVFLNPEIRVGDYVFLRNGYATTVLNDQEAFEILDLLEEIASLHSL